MFSQCCGFIVVLQKTRVLVPVQDGLVELFVAKQVKCFSHSHVWDDLSNNRKQNFRDLSSSFHFGDYV